MNQLQTNSIASALAVLIAALAAKYGLSLSADQITAVIAAVGALGALFVHHSGVAHAKGLPESLKPIVDLSTLFPSKTQAIPADDAPKMCPLCNQIGCVHQLKAANDKP